MSDPALRVAIVTGGTRGIGAAITEQLIRSGVRVIAFYRSNSQVATTLQSRLQGEGFSLALRQFDLMDPRACADAVRAVVAEFGRIDYLVNNAGITRDAPTIDTTDEDWNELIGTNLAPVFYLTRTVLPFMIDAGFGRIVNVTSIAGTMGSASQSGYAATKAGVHGFSRSVAREVARRGITVNCVAPGPIETDITAETDPSMLTKIIAAVPMRRIGRAEEVSHIVCMLLADQASFTTGTVIGVDGGLSM